jgi:1-phosphofructokinase family hexose kinase
MLLCIGPTPAVQRIMLFRRVTPGAVNRAFETVEGIAGKSINVAKVLKTLGGAPLATGFLGGERGRFIAQELQARNVAADFVAVAAPTRQCITVIDESAHTVTELVEESRAVGVRDYERLLAKVRRHSRRCRAMVISGSLTPGGPPDFYRRCVELANRVGALSVVDAQGPALREALKARPGVIKPNRAELAATVGRELKTERSILKAMR